MTLPRGSDNSSSKGHYLQASDSCHCPDESCHVIEKEMDETYKVSSLESSPGSVGSCQSVHYLSMVSSRSLGSSSENDVERLKLERIRIAISGSNCPGCTRKIARILHSYPFLRNLQIHAMPLQAEFDLDVTKVSIHETMTFIRKAIDRKCKRIGDGWLELQIVVPPGFQEFEYLIRSEGVMDKEYLAKDVFCLKYDARKVGARDILDSLNAGNHPQFILAAQPRGEIPLDLWRAGCLTSMSLVLTLPILILAWAPLPEHEVVYESISLVLATVVQVFVAGPFYPKALKSLLLNGEIDMDLLILLSTSTAYIVSVAAYICKMTGSSSTPLGMFFETSALLISLIMLGRFMADLACHRVITSKSIRSLQPRSALRVVDPAIDGEDLKETDVRLLHIDDIIKLQPHCVVPTDGIIENGESEFDESMITGEAKLVTRSKGCTVVAGSTNHSATVTINATRLPGENTIDEIADMVEEVSRSKPRAQVIADRVARWVVPGIAALALLTLLVWIFIGVLVRGESIGLAILHAMPYAVSVLIVSCPCAIGLVIPILQVIAGTIAASYGVILRSAEVLTAARKVDHVVFDKTGTLTDRSLSVLSEQYCSDLPDFAASLVLALTSSSDHPVSSTVADYLQARGVSPVSVNDLETAIGRGVRGRVNDQIVRVGSARWLGVEHLALVQSLYSKNMTVLCAAHGTHLVAVFGLEAAVRHDAAEVVARLKGRGIQVSIMSGDETGAVLKVARELGIQETWARCTPKEKQQHVKKMMQSGGKTVLFCGDGINDAAALTQASVGLHMNGGADLTLSAADATLTGTSLKGVIVMIDLSRDCYYQIIFGFSWSAFYNIFAILFAAGAFIKIRLPPEYAGLGEAISVLPVILVPLRLRLNKYW